MPSQWTIFDIQGSATTTNHNVYSSTTVGTTLTSCVDIDGTAVDHTLTMLTTYGGGTTGGIQTANDIFSANDCDDGYYISTAGTEQDWDIGGLNNSLTYEIRITAARTNEGQSTDRHGDYTIDGTTLDVDARGTAANRIGTWTGVSPTSGVISMNITVPTGSTFSYINAIAIREEDAAAGAALPFDTRLVFHRNLITR